MSSWALVVELDNDTHIGRCVAARGSACEVRARTCTHARTRTLVHAHFLLPVLTPVNLVYHELQGRDVGESARGVVGVCRAFGA